MTVPTSASAFTPEQKPVLDVLQRLYAAWAANDADAFAALYLEDATVVLPGGVYHKTRDEVRSYMAAAFAGPMKGSRAIDDPQNVRVLGGHTAIVISEARILMAGETELPADRRRRATWVLARQDGAWRIAAYHNCAAS